MADLVFSHSSGDNMSINSIMTVLTGTSTTNATYGHNLSHPIYSFKDICNSFSPEEASPVEYILAWILFCTGLPLTTLAIIALYFLIQNDHVAPIFAINLLLTDLLQLCSMFVFQITNVCRPLFYYIYTFGVMVSVGFMVCISMERYLLVAWPLWYRFRRSIRSSVLVCLGVWFFPAVVLLPVLALVDLDTASIIYGGLLLLPFPLFIFFPFGTIKALSTSQGVPSNKKKQIVALLVVVLLIYTLLFLPTIIWCLFEIHSNTFTSLAFSVLTLSPLADLTLYIFIRKDVANQLTGRKWCCVAVGTT